MVQCQFCTPYESVVTIFTYAFEVSVEQCTIVTVSFSGKRFLFSPLTLFCYHFQMYAYFLNF